MAKTETGANGKRLATAQSVDAAVKSICEQKEIDARGYDLKAVNPHARRDEETRTPEELLDIIAAKGREVADAVAELRRLL